MTFSEPYFFVGNQKEKKMDEVGPSIFPDLIPIFGANGEKISIIWSKKDNFFTM